MGVKEYLWELLPDFNTTSGFVFYSMALYGSLVFSAWLVNPTLEKEYVDEMKKAKLRDRGEKMRKKNKMEKCD